MMQEWILPTYCREVFEIAWILHETWIDFVFNAPQSSTVDNLVGQGSWSWYLRLHHRCYPDQRTWTWQTDATRIMRKQHAPYGILLILTRMYFLCKLVCVHCVHARFQDRVTAHKTLMTNALMKNQRRSRISTVGAMLRSIVQWTSADCLRKDAQMNQTLFVSWMTLLQRVQCSWWVSTTQVCSMLHTLLWKLP